MQEPRKRAPVIEVTDYTQGLATITALLIAGNTAKAYINHMPLSVIEAHIVTASWIMYLAEQGGDYAVQNESTQPVQLPVRRKGERRGTH